MTLERLREAAGDGYVYLASPYSKYHDGLALAHRQACRAAGFLIGAGIPVFCPIAHSHPISAHASIEPFDHAIWLPADAPFLRAAAALCVYRLPGWGESFGVLAEIREFRALGRPFFSMSTSFEVLEHTVG